VEIDSHGHKAYDDELVDATRSYFKMSADTASTVGALAEHYRQRNAAAVVFTVDAESGMGHTPNSVDELILKSTSRHNGRGTVTGFIMGTRKPAVLVRLRALSMVML
jgi:hypothetical protein